MSVSACDNESMFVREWPDHCQIPPNNNPAFLCFSAQIRNQTQNQEAELKGLNLTKHILLTQSQKLVYFLQVRTLAWLLTLSVYMSNRLCVYLDYLSMFNTYLSVCISPYACIWRPSHLRRALYILQHSWGYWDSIGRSEAIKSRFGKSCHVGLCN